jgi:hypothetical protein
VGLSQTWIKGVWKDNQFISRGKHQSLGEFMELFINKFFISCVNLNN